MKKLNVIKTIKLSSQMDKELKEISDKMGFSQTNLIRFLLNRSLVQLRYDCLRAGGFDKLELTLRKV